MEKKTKKRREEVLDQKLRPFPGGRGVAGLAHMNNLFWIPGIVCQGDDGRPVSKPKQTDMENTHSASHGRMTGLSEAARHLLFSFSGWELCSDAATTAPFYSDLMNPRRGKKEKAPVEVEWDQM